MVRLLQDSTETSLGVPSTNLYMKEWLLPDNILTIYIHIHTYKYIYTYIHTKKTPKKPTHTRLLTNFVRKIHISLHFQQKLT